MTFTLAGTSTGAANAVVQPKSEFTPGPLTWTQCDPDDEDANPLECAELQVPLDYANPEGTTIKIAVTRIKHTSSGEDYKGAVLLNPGGPGASGVFMPYLNQAVPGTVATKYDWIGFAPRGIGESTPSVSCNKGYYKTNRPFYEPTTPALEHYWTKAVTGYAKACKTSPTAALLAHMKTTDSVQDMDSIRQALGLEKISFYGFSYGTYLGAVYATKYPTRVDRLILDGVVDPGRVWYGGNLDQDVAFETSMDYFWKFVARTDSRFHLGKNWKSIRAGYYKKIQALRTKPLANKKFGPDELSDSILEAGYYVYDWYALADEYSLMIRKGKAGPLLARYVDANVGDDNGYVGYLATQCTDAKWPDYARNKHDATALNRRFKFLTWANTWFNAPCINWPAASGTPVAINGAALTGKVLLMSETYDAATPFSGALALRKLFPSASLIEGVAGTTHAASLSGVPCVDNTIATYLETGNVPARTAGNKSDLRCQRVPIPSPTARNVRVAKPAGISGDVRRQLIEAQMH